MTKTIGKKRWGQTTLMKTSASYPLGVGVAVVGAWASSRPMGIFMVRRDNGDDEGLLNEATGWCLGKVSDASLVSSASSLFGSDQELDPGLLSN